MVPLPVYPEEEVKSGSRLPEANLLCLMSLILKKNFEIGRTLLEI